jgi:hypothetical protein
MKRCYPIDLAQRHTIPIDLAIVGSVVETRHLPTSNSSEYLVIMSFISNHQDPLMS